MGTRRAMSSMRDVKLAYLDVETTGLSPAMGDRIVEVGMIVCRGKKVIEQLSQLVNPQQPMPARAQAVHGISDEDVATSPTFDAIARDVRKALRGAWIVGHCVRFDIGFLSMETASANVAVSPAGCLDTRQLSTALWDLSNYQLGTVADTLGVAGDQAHRALSDAEQTRGIFHRVIADLGGWSRVTTDDLLALHSHAPTWPDNPRRALPDPLYDALTNGSELAIRYVNGDGERSTRTIQPVACFSAGRYTYVRAQCSKSGELRTFRVDRMIVDHDSRT